VQLKGGGNALKLEEDSPGVLLLKWEAKVFRFLNLNSERRKDNGNYLTIYLLGVLKSTFRLRYFEGFS